MLLQLVVLISTALVWVNGFQTTPIKILQNLKPRQETLNQEKFYNNKFSFFYQKNLHELNRRGRSSSPPPSSQLWQQDTSEDFSGISDENNDATRSNHPFSRALNKFKARPGTYLIIPCVAAAVGWITNWMAVQMIFYPIKFRGIPLYIRKEVPLGLLGWQGIVPCKSRPMSEAMVNMVTTQLLSVKEVFQRIKPRRISTLLAPRVPIMIKEVMTDFRLPKVAQAVPESIFQGLPSETQSILHGYNRKFLQDMVKALQKNIDSIFNIQKCVQTQMLADRTLLGKLFQKCGQKELDFLTNSGLWFGFLLGIIQMVVALFWDNPWSLSIGGAIVGYATNWLALKWIFEPVNPTRVGPFILQGQFLRRQKEVSREFSKFFANKILNSKELWKSILQEASFVALFTQHFTKIVNAVTRGLGVYTPEPEAIKAISRKALDTLPQHVPVLYEYMDDALNLEESLRIKMEKMSSEQFEQVLHPIFEEDELTLILAGAFLGLAAGLVQQGLETGKIKLPPVWKHCKLFLLSVKQFFRNHITRRFSKKNDDSTLDETTS